MKNIKNKTNLFSLNNCWTFLIIILFIGFIFLLHFNSFTSPWEGDEGEYAYSAWLMRQDIVPYTHSFLQKPPLIVYTYYLSHFIKPYSIWLPRFLGFLSTVGVCFLLALTARKLYGNRAGWLALWVSSLLLSVSTFDALPANTEKFMLLPLTALLTLFVYKQRRENFLIYFSAGSLAALAILYKPIALLPSAFLIVYWLISNWYKSNNIKKILISISSVILGGVITSFVCLAYFIFNGAFRDLWQEVFVFNVAYVSDMKSYFPEYFYRYITQYFIIFWPIIIIAFTSFFYKNKFIYLWWALLLVSLVTVMTSRIAHYYLLLAPFLVLLGAGAFSSLLEKINIKQQAEKLKNIILVGSIAFILIIFSLVIGEQFFLKPIELTKWLYGPDNTFGESMLMADKVNQYTRKDEKIFIGGSEPQIYYFSQRVSASKFNMTFPLSLNTPWCKYYQEQAIIELKNNKPAAIVLPLGASGLLGANTPTNFVDYLLAKIKENYRLVGGTVSKYEVSTYVGSEWLEPDQIKLIPNIMLLYIKK
jgi:hypothetical protein